LPTIIDNESILDEFSYIGRALAALSALTIAGFTWWVFRKKARWAKWALWTDGVLLLADLAVSAIEGDWVGAHPLSYKGFWFEWLGGIVPFTWLAVESLHAYSLSRRRVRIGLGDPIVSNRFLLIGLYGALASCTYPIFLWMYIMYERNGTWSDPLSVFARIIEIVSLVTLWVSFAAPAFYQRWVGNAQQDA